MCKRYIANFLLLQLAKVGLAKRNLFKLNIWEVKFYLFVIPDTHQYCWQNGFNATCNENEVILMEHAHYGRMRDSHCLTSTAHLGCYADVLPQLDARCSGHRSCKVIFCGVASAFGFLWWTSGDVSNFLFFWSNGTLYHGQFDRILSVLMCPYSFLPTAKNAHRLGNVKLSSLIAFKECWAPVHPIPFPISTHLSSLLFFPKYNTLLRFPRRGSYISQTLSLFGCDFLQYLPVFLPLCFPVSPPPPPLVLLS